MTDAERGARVAPGRAPLVRGFAGLAGRVTGTEPPGVFLTLGRNQRLFWTWLAFAGSMMPGGKLTRRETEAVILRVAALAQSEYEWAQHARLGRRAGLSAGQVDELATGPRDGRWSTAEQWSRRDQVLLTAAEELLATEDLSDAGWQALRAEFDEPRCVEIVLLVGHYRMLATALRALRVPVDRARPGAAGAGDASSAVAP
ncbi:carboxymuconolactone decarboxylase family protein [Nocardioides sp. R-C-SC26]|uniref:carboxymuconolactone decarboxylase family protein n=1 Tax=Nocardioides sp. R-C-SC26 TaxID=2870414 RepID=UPI001E504098|nr:carboxymuconolactone decarboxylase family protein [Nocardioides sp. R-C-SC26]